MALEKGDKIPQVLGVDQDGKEVKASDYAGKKLVLYFYPKDNTPGCTAQACNLKDNNAELLKAGYQVLGVSTDSEASHQKFIEKYGLPFLLLADTEHRVAEEFGVWKLKKNFGKEYMGIERSTFVIDKEGKLAKEWRKVKVKGHVEEALAFIRENLN